MKTKTLRVTLAVTGILLALLICLALLCLAARLEIRWDAPDLTLEYNEDYLPAEASACVTFPPTGLVISDIPVQTDDPVRPGVTGVYTVTVQSRLLWLEAVRQRTVTVTDTQAPTITLEGGPETLIYPGTPYVEEGYSAHDDYDGDLTAAVRVRREGAVITYTVSDRAGNTVSAQRTLRDHDPYRPELTLLGDRELHIPAGTPFEEPGWTARDNIDGDLTAAVTAEGEVNFRRAGNYVRTYTVTDSFGNVTQVHRLVLVDAAPKKEAVVPEGKTIYLTFDDGPGKYTQRLLDILREYNVHATFFVVNTDYTDLLPRMAADGHAIGVHSRTHNYEAIYASEDAWFADFDYMHDRIYALTGVDTKLLRFPGGSSNTVSSFNEGIMTRLTQMVTDCGLQYFDWNVLSGDAGEVYTADAVYENVIAGVADKDYSIVLQHDIKEFSVDAVERIIQWGLENGYTFRSLDETSPRSHHRINN